MQTNYDAQKFPLFVKTFMSGISSKIKVNKFHEMNYDSLIVTMPSGREYLIGYDDETKKYFNMRGETIHSFNRMEPDDFEWIEMNNSMESLSHTCCDVIVHDKKEDFDSFMENLQCHLFDMLEGE